MKDDENEKLLAINEIRSIGIAYLKTKDKTYNDEQEEEE